MKAHFEVSKIGNMDDHINMLITKIISQLGIVQSITELENTYFY